MHKNTELYIVFVSKTLKGKQLTLIESLKIEASSGWYISNLIKSSECTELTQNLPFRI